MTQRLSLTFALLTGLIGGMSSHYLLPTPLQAQTPLDRDGILHVRGVVVEDQNGRERVRLGATVSDALSQGVRRKRVAPVSGVLISDAAGNERGGFTTNDLGEAFIGLDSETEQQVLLLANPKGGVHLDLFDSKGNEADIAVFPNGPRVVLKKEKTTVLTLPQ